MQKYRMNTDLNKIKSVRGLWDSIKSSTLTRVSGENDWHGKRFRKSCKANLTRVEGKTQLPVRAQSGEDLKEATAQGTSSAKVQRKEGSSWNIREEERGAEEAEGERKKSLKPMKAQIVERQHKTEL